MFALNVAYPIEDAARVLAGWRDAVADAPDELSTAGLIWSLPVVDELPEHAARRCRTSASSACTRATRPRASARRARLRELATPLLDMSGPVAYLDFQRSLDPFFPAGAALLLEGALPRRLLRRRDRHDRRLVAAAPVGATRSSIIRHCGGAIARVGAEETAFGDRSSEWMLSIDSTWDDPADDATQHRLDARLLGRRVPFSHGKTYFNFPGLLEEGDAAVRASYGANHDRLARSRRSTTRRTSSGSTRTSAPRRRAGR